MSLPSGPELSGEVSISRRAFLGCCTSLVLASAGCAQLTSNARSTYALIIDPSLPQYQGVLDGLIRCVLPCEQPDFPVSADQVRTHLLTLFPLETDPRFGTLQRALMLFDQVDLFPHGLVTSQEEERALDAEADSQAAAAMLTQARAHDLRLFDVFARGERPPHNFAAQPLARQREYLELWRLSGFVLRRHFYASARSIVMISAYSMDSVWKAIGYAGPLIHPSTD